MVRLSKVKKPTLGCYSLLHFVWIYQFFPFLLQDLVTSPLLVSLESSSPSLFSWPPEFLAVMVRYCRNALQFGLTWCFYVIRLRLWAMRFIGSTWQQHCLSHWGFNGDHSHHWGTVNCGARQVTSLLPLQILIRKLLTESSLCSGGRGLSPTPWIRQCAHGAACCWEFPMGRLVPSPPLT